MQINAFQVIAITLYAFIATFDMLETDLGLSKPVIAGFFAGLIMGNVTLGLAVGATLQLMILGVGTYGGASIPDYMTAALIGTVFGVLSGKGLEFAIGLAVPIGLLMVQLDVLARFSNTYFQHRADKYADEGNIKGIELMNILGMLPWGLSRAIPTFLACIFGSTIVSSIVNYFPDWLMGGLKTAGGILPVVGIAILLRFLPTKKYIAYLLIGFVLASYLKVSMVGVSIIGLALAMIEYSKISKEKAPAVSTSSSLENKENGDNTNMVLGDE
jgi:PTS system mannose-specific IIC component